MSDDKDRTGQREFEQKARRVFQESVERLDAASLSRLNRARQRALSEFDGERSGRHGWLPIGAAVAAALVVAVWVGRDVADTGGVSEMAAAEEADDLVIVLEGEDFGMLADLEFYDWVGAETDDRGEPGGSGNIG